MSCLDKENSGTSLLGAEVRGGRRESSVGDDRRHYIRGRGSIGMNNMLGII